MITVDNKDKDCFILTPSLLRVGDTGEKFGKIRSINVKKDSLGNPFLQLVVKMGNLLWLDYSEILLENMLWNWKNIVIRLFF